MPACVEILVIAICVQVIAVIVAAILGIVLLTEGIVLGGTVSPLPLIYGTFGKLILIGIFAATLAGTVRFIETQGRSGFEYRFVAKLATAIEKIVSDFHDPVD